MEPNKYFHPFKLNLTAIYTEMLKIELKKKINTNLLFLIYL